jgi:serine acetyltransferase
MVGAGAFVHEDILGGVVVVGVPARVMQSVKTPVSIFDAS